MENFITIILAAANHISDSAYVSQMIPVRGKPALAWVIESCDNSEKIVVLEKSNTTTVQYIQTHYKDVDVAIIDKTQFTDFSILSSLSCGLSRIQDKNKTVRVVLGDTLCDQKDIPTDIDMILTSLDFSDSLRWCLTENTKDGYVNKLFDKINVDIADKSALVGVYQFTDVNCLINCVADTIQDGKHNLSDLLLCYNNQHKIKSLNCKKWFDLGHKSGIINAQNDLFNSRSFNKLDVDPVLGTITKISPKKQKLYDEWMWCKNLPEALRILCPRPIAFNEDEKCARMTMELYGYPALSELFILGNLTLEEWKLILDRLFLVHKEIEEYTGNLNTSNFVDLYKNKTWSRFDELLAQNDYWKTLWDMDELIINGKVYKNIRLLIDVINDKIDNIIKNINVTVMHGDYCFSNILFDTNSFICRLIDPRGRLTEQTIYGDPRYDIAKLRHSVVGLYDFIVHGMFSISQNGNMFKFESMGPSFGAELSTYFDCLIEKHGYSLEEIKLIEALLFASMIPLHSDNLQRQQVFYLKAVMKFNELVKKGD